MPSPLRRFRSFGARTPELAAAAASPSVRLAAEHVSVTARGSLRTPFRTSSSFVSHHTGALVLTADQLLVSVGRRTFLRSWPTEDDPEGSVQVEVDESGVHLVIDIARAVPGGTGRVEVAVSTAIPLAVFAALPARTWVTSLEPVDPSRLLTRI